MKTVKSLALIWAAQLSESLYTMGATVPQRATGRLPLLGRRSPGAGSRALIRPIIAFTLSLFRRLEVICYEASTNYLSFAAKLSLVTNYVASSWPEHNYKVNGHIFVI